MSRCDQERLLATLFAVTPHPLRGRTYVQKLAFLINREADANAFHFNAGEYGPFHVRVYELVNEFIDSGLITESEDLEDLGPDRVVRARIRYEYEATEAIADVFDDGEPPSEYRTAAATVFETYPTDDLRALLEAIFTQYPEIARNAIIIP